MPSPLVAAVRSWHGDPGVKKFIIESAGSKTFTLQEFFNKRMDQSLDKKFCRQSPQKFPHKQLLEALAHLRNCLCQLLEAEVVNGSTESGYRTASTSSSSQCRCCSGARKASEAELRASPASVSSVSDQLLGAQPQQPQPKPRHSLIDRRSQASGTGHLAVSKLEEEPVYDELYSKAAAAPQPRPRASLASQPVTRPTAACMVGCNQEGMLSPDSQAMATPVLFKSIVKDLKGSKKVHQFVIKNSPKDLKAEDFLAKNHSERLSSKFADIKKQPFPACELSQFLDQLKRRSQAAVTSGDSAYGGSACSSRQISAASFCASVAPAAGQAGDARTKTAKAAKGEWSATRVVRPAQQLAVPPPILTPGEERPGSDPQQLSQPLLPTAAPRVAERQHQPPQRPPSTQPSPAPPPPPGGIRQSGLINYIGNRGSIVVRDDTR